MRIRILVNIVFTGLAVCWLLQGFGESWSLSVLPLLIAIGGSIAGCVPGRSFAAGNAVCSVASALVLWVGMLLALASLALLVMGSSAAAVERANSDAFRLGILGLMSLTSGLLALRQIRKPAIST